MYARCGKLNAQAGKRPQFIEILLRAAALVSELPGCHAYIVHADLDDESGIWVYELWDSPAEHAASLSDPRVRALISEGMPLIAGAPSGAALEVSGGHGLP